MLKLDNFIEDFVKHNPKITEEIAKDLIMEFSAMLITEFNNYSTAQYRMFKTNPSRLDSDNLYYRSEGADKCINIVYDLLDKEPNT